MDLESIPVLSDLIKMITIYSPHIAFALITLALGWVIGRFTSFILNRIVRKMGLETVFRKTSMGRAILRAGYTPSGFFATLGKGFVYMFSILSALSVLAIPPITTAVQAFIEYLPNLIMGVLILVFGLTFADWISESVEKGGSSAIQSSLLSGLVRILLYFVIITVALAQMKIDVTILYILAQAFAWSLAIAIGIAFGWNLKDRIGPLIEKTMPRKEKTKNTASENP